MRKSKEDIEFRKFILTLIILFIAFLITHFLFSFNLVSGNSMSNTVNDGGIVFTNKCNYNISRYDIVIAKANMFGTNKDEVVIKRVIGLPNEKVNIMDGVVYVNDTPISKYNFPTESVGDFSKELVLKDNEYFLLGDNRKDSYDSRFYGGVSSDKIIGRVEHIIYKSGE